MQRFIKKISPNTRLLRTCKQVNAEASSIFYGGVEWRFTSVKGWYVLDAFLEQIGIKSQARLRKITIHVPWDGSMIEPDYRCKDAIRESKARISVMQGTIARMGLNPRQSYKEFNYAACVERTKRIPEHYGKLESLRLVLPDTFNLAPAENGSYDRALNQSKFRGTLQIILFSLRGGNVLEDNSYYANWEAVSQSIISGHKQAKVMAGKLGWKGEVAA